MGYYRAGFDVVGVDLMPQPNFPFRFFRCDALEYLTLYGDRYDVIHASPPCQAHTTMSNRWRGKDGKADSHENLIPDTRTFLQGAGVPYVIENVPGARRWLRDPILLHGGMFGLGVHRPRLFECLPLLAPHPPAPQANDPIGVYGKLDGRRLMTRKDGSMQRAAKTLEQGQRAMGIDWMKWPELTEAIPPAYTTWLGSQLLDLLSVARVAA